MTDRSPGHSSITAQLSPVMPTPDVAILYALSLLGVEAGNPQTVFYDLGSNDGRVLIRAATTLRVRCVGIELFEDKCQQAICAIEAAGLTHLAEVRSDRRLGKDLRRSPISFFGGFRSGTRTLQRPTFPMPPTSSCSWVPRPTKPWTQSFGPGSTPAAAWSPTSSPWGPSSSPTCGRCMTYARTERGSRRAAPRKASTPASTYTPVSLPERFPAAARFCQRGDVAAAGWRCATTSGTDGVGVVGTAALSGQGSRHLAPKETPSPKSARF